MPKNYVTRRDMSIFTQIQLIWGRLTRDMGDTGDLTDATTNDTQSETASQGRILEDSGMIYLRKSKRSISKLIFHHFGGTPPEGTNVRSIRTLHLQRGFNDIGYHAIIMPDGELQIGRDIDKMGAHAQGSNRGSIGIMFVAGMGPGQEHTTPTRAQLATARGVIEECKRNYPGIELLGHRDTKATLCPGFDIHHWYETNEIRK